MKKYIGLILIAVVLTLNVYMWVIIFGDKTETHPPVVLEDIKSRLWVYLDFTVPFPAYFLVDVGLCREYLYLPPAPPVELRRSNSRPCDIIPFKGRR